MKRLLALVRRSATRKIQNVVNASSETPAIITELSSNLLLSTIAMILDWPYLRFNDSRIF